MNESQQIGQKRRKRTLTASGDALVSRLQAHIIGQPQAVKAVAPYVRMFQAGLAPEGRPAGVFLFLGPTGTGKTRTVEALAEVLHGSRKSLLRIDCGEYQMDHEVAKLVGAPPGYLGHRETHPVLTQARLAAVTSERCPLSIVLFDEVEKAAPSLTRLLLGILDKASLRLGDNNTVNFERTLIFLTSNVGARTMQRALRPGFGFEHANQVVAAEPERMEKIAIRAAQRSFAPEFLNRVDVAVTYQPLSDTALNEILDLQIRELQEHISSRLGSRAFSLEVPSRVRAFLLKKGVSAEYGAREIRRTVQQHLTQPLAALVADGLVRPGQLVRADLDRSSEHLSLKAA
jgi:ATP-dependent Clp protease ATP-binding subunit ClpA